MSLRTFFFGEIPCLLADSLKNAPERWELTWLGSEIVRDDEITVWIGNSVCGVDVSSHSIAGYGHRGAILWGGVTMLSVFGLSPGHWLLHGAAKRWLARKALDASAALPVPVREAL